MIHRHDKGRNHRPQWPAQVMGQRLQWFGKGRDHRPRWSADLGSTARSPQPLTSISQSTLRFLLLALLTLAPSLLSAQNYDVVHFPDGEPVVCRIEGATDNIVAVSFPGREAPGGGPLKRTFPADQVSHIEWGFAEGEQIVFENLERANAESLEFWWNHHFSHLHRPRSRTAAYGIAFGDRLIRNDSEAIRKRGLGIFNRVIEKAWSEKDIADAKKGRLRALMSLGQLEQARTEARSLAAETEDPTLLIEVRYLLAQADFEQLKALQEEHPRWIEDDEIRPQRESLYHNVIDQLLWPSLFYASETDGATRGLLAAAQVYLFAEDSEKARAVLTDLTRLYPETRAAETAQTRLASLDQSSQESSTTELPTDTESP
ncbi:MAG: hypothetical protein AAF236_10730 [Verrucomicrobiota bacterium]